MNFNVQNEMILPYSVTTPNQMQALSSNSYESEYQKCCLRVAEANAKVEFAKEKRLEEYGIKLAMKEAYEERKRGITEVIEVVEDGTLTVVSKNLDIASRPRTITNMRFPELVILRRLDGQSGDICYFLRCQVDMRPVQIYLSGKKLLKGNYLLLKLTNAGVFFEIAKQSKLKELLVQFLAKMISECNEEMYVPDKPGWYLTNDGEYKFLEEGELNWEAISKMM